MGIIVMEIRCKKILPAISFIFTSVIILILFIIKGYAPFGGNSLAYMDANIQYLDFFSYLKDVIAGSNNICYSFSKVLGGTNIGIFSYYLSSPFTLLVVFFAKKDLHTFFDLLILLKLSLTAVTFSFFILKRFAKNFNNDLNLFKYCTVIMLSVSYALSQYTIAQSSNIMWLDGVYMLPLVLLGVYYIVQGKYSLLLSISVTITTFFNWYISGINCLFSAIWLFFEIFCYIAEEGSIDNRPFLKKFFPVIKRYLYSMVLGVCGSAVLFFPTIYAMKNSSRGNLFFGLFKDISVPGIIFSLLQKLKLAFASPYSRILLFCGCFILICFILFLFSKRIHKKTKIIFTCIILATCIVSGIVLFMYKIKTVYVLDGKNLYSLVKEGLSVSGWIPSVIQNYSLGSVSAYGSVSLYCGCFAITGFISCFLTKNILRKIKIIFAGLSVLTVLFFYWNVFFVLFSLLKSVGSYWYRYSHVGIIVILFIAAYFYTSDIHQDNRGGVFIKSSACFCLLQLVLHIIKPVENMQLLVYTIAFVIITALMAAYCIKSRKYILPALTCIIYITVLDVSYNAYLLMDKYHTSDVETYSVYETGAEKQINEIKKKDNSFYRITQTDTRNMGQNRLTAYYNEAFAYNYNSISGYTSSPDDIQRQFLDRLGYRINDENMCIINTSILAADSLMTVKYVISPMDINGLEKIEDIDIINGKYVYKNPYALPVAVIYENKGFDYGNIQNPFEFQNNIYSTLIGRQVELYKPLDFSITQEGDINTGTPLIYSIEIPAGNFSVYGNISWYSEMDSMLNVNNVYSTSYSCWLSPSVFYIPVTCNGSGEKAVIEVKSNVSYDVKYGEEQFYALDLDMLKEISGILADSVPDNIEIENGYVHINTDGHSNQEIYLAVPYDKGWTIYLNGREISAGLAGECMYSIPLSEGNNDIKMVYHCRGLVPGIFVSIISIVLIIFTAIIEKKKLKI